MAIISRPSLLEQSGNLPEFVISANASFLFTLKKGAATIFEQYYDPGLSGLVNIDLREIIEENLSFSFIESESVYEQPNLASSFTAVVGAEEYSFNVVKGGVDKPSDTASNFLTTNWLTWQPQKKKVTYYQPEFLSYYAVLGGFLKCKAYFSDNTSEILALATLVQSKAYTVPCQYSVINNLLTKKLPAYYDVYVENAQGNKITYIQRFISDNRKSENEQWFLFENSLSGIDTFRAYGKISVSGEHSHKLSSFDDSLEEYSIETSRKFQKNTGSLDHYERKWLLDFFPSKKKYVYWDSSIRQISVIESDVQYDSSIDPDNYNFTYQFTTSLPFLNLTRSETLPEEITLEVPGLESFTLPPRLIDIPRVSPSEGAILLLQDPFSETPGTTTIGALLSYILGSSTIIDFTNSISDFEQKFLSKISPDIAQKVITFLEGIKVGDFQSGLTGAKIDLLGNAEFRTLLIRELSKLFTTEFGDFQQGYSGAKIDQYGHAELKSATIRQFLEVPELRYNRVKINIGDSWSAPGGGIIQSVDYFNKIITLKLEEGEIGAIAENDICMGIFHSTTLQENSTENIDDSKGNRAFTGFATSYFRVTEIIDTVNNSQFRYEMRPVSGVYPAQISPKMSMTFVAYGNFIDTDRQTSHYDTRTYQRYLKNMSGWEISVSNIAAQFGDLSNLSIHGLVMQGYSAYLNNIYMTGTIQQFVLAEPLRMSIDSSMGWMLGASEETEITIKIYKGWALLTEYMTSWSWIRDTGDAADDLVWNNAHADLTDHATLTFADLGATANTNNSCLFTITATYIENELPQTISETLAI